MGARTVKTGKLFITDEPYYDPAGDAIQVFVAANKQKLPVLLKELTS